MTTTDRPTSGRAIALQAVHAVHVADLRATADQTCHSAAERRAAHELSLCSDAFPCPPCKALVEYAVLRASAR